MTTTQEAEATSRATTVEETTPTRKS
jgi:hypothetical protein